MEGLLEQAQTLLIQFGPPVLAAMVIFVVGRLASGNSGHGKAMARKSKSTFR